MKTGYPAHISIDDLCNKFASNEDFNKYICTNQKDFCSILLRACQLKWNHFKIGNTKIFFRDGKFEMLTQKLKSDSKEILFRMNKLKLLRSKFYFTILVARIAARFLVMGKRSQINAGINVDMTSHSGEIQSRDEENRTGKKRKFDTQSVQCNLSSKRIIGNFVNICFMIVVFFDVQIFNKI